MKSCLIAWRRITLTISSIQIKKAQNVHFSGIQSFFFHFIIDSMRTDSIIPPHLLRQDNKQDGRLAQLGEHRPYKARVTGSSPVASTTFFESVLRESLVQQLRCDNFVTNHSRHPPLFASNLIYRTLSSVGRASPLQGEGHWFKPSSVHHFFLIKFP